jgi:hypothetical protein
LRANVTVGLLVFLFTFAIYTLCLNGVWATDHPTSFLQLDWAIWNGHTFVLGSTAANFKPNSADDFAYNGNYYSALAPGTAILALPFVGLGFLAEGHFDIFGDTMFLSELFVALVNAVAASIVYLVGRLFFDKRVSVFLAFTYAFSTISWPFAAYFFQSDVSACFDLLAAYFALRIARDGRNQLRDSLFAGAAVAVAMTVDYINAVFLPIVFVYIVFSIKGQKKPLLEPLLGFVAVALLGLLSIFAYDYVNFGSVFRTTEQLYLNSSNVLTEFSYPLYLGAYLNLFSAYRGLFLYSLILVFGVFGFYEAFRDKAWSKEGLFLFVCFLGIFLPYSMWYDPGGGDSFGPRFLVAAIPFLLIPAGIILQSAGRRVWQIAFGLFSVGVVVNGIAALTSSISPASSFNLSPFLYWNLPLFLNGNLDTWWIHYVGPYWAIPSAVVIGLAIAIPAVADLMLARSAPDARVR